MLTFSIRTLLANDPAVVKLDDDENAFDRIERATVIERCLSYPAAVTHYQVRALGALGSSRPTFRRGSLHLVAQRASLALAAAFDDVYARLQAEAPRGAVFASPAAAFTLVPSPPNSTAPHAENRLVARLEAGCLAALPDARDRRRASYLCADTLSPAWVSTWRPTFEVSRRCRELGVLALK